jgi:hypothetical protein
MKRLRALASATLLVASLVAATTLQTRTYAYSVSGTEVTATSTKGRFVGTASGSAFGTWYAEVLHDPLGPGAVDIRPGGSFGMVLSRAEPAHAVSGRFADGSITVVNPGAGCTDQTYAVSGLLGGVSVTGTGNFTVTLTHHRRSALGRCWLYAATVSGRVTLP